MIFDGEPLDPVQNFPEIREYFDDAIQIGNMAECKEYADYIASFLTSNKLKLNREMIDEYESFWVKLTFKSFVDLSGPDQEELLKKKVFSAFQEGMEPSDIINPFFEMYEDQEFIAQLFKGFITALEQNEEKLGEFPIEVEGRRLFPQIKNWILDYSKFPSKMAKRSAIERLNYINQSTNVRPLTQLQRQQLIKVLELYDHFINGDRPLLTEKTPEQVSDIKPQPRLEPTHMTIFNPTKIDIDGKLEELRSRVSK